MDFTIPEDIQAILDKVRAFLEKEIYPIEGEFLEKGFTFISIGNDLHHVLTQSTAYVLDLESIAKNKNKNWVRRPTALM